jgi:hypothetical protein
VLSPFLISQRRDGELCGDVMPLPPFPLPRSPQLGNDDEGKKKPDQQDDRKRYIENAGQHTRQNNANNKAGRHTYQTPRVRQTPPSQSFHHDELLFPFPYVFRVIEFHAASSNWWRGRMKVRPYELLLLTKSQ